MILRDRLLPKDVERGAGDAAVLQCVDQRGLVDQRSTRGVDEIGAWLHQRQFMRADDAAGAFAQHQMQADDVACGKQLVLLDARDADVRGRLGGQVLAPGDDVHLQRLRDAGDLAADLAEADEAERAAVKLNAEARLPAALADQAVLVRDLPRTAASISAMVSSGVP